MCLYGCQHGYRGRFCPKDVGNKSEKQTLLTAALGRGLGGGIMALIILAIIAMVWFRKRRRSNTERNTSVHDGDYATVDANLREVELRDLKYETLQETDVHTMNQTTDYSNVSDNVNDNITYLEERLRRPTRKGCAMDPAEQVCIALRYYATGKFFNVVGDTMRRDKRQFVVWLKM
ncbi:uncharacterized protein LOC128204593 [Mya arenaria]|uniref:uncharacterized protein LOC128204593 n=1 Tax=Mya arenaria TaxID=6604 RepID=UPI0022E993B0|nr:uncharacterized protein LOC128204593 [Mya arenaria]